MLNCNLYVSGELRLEIYVELKRIEKKNQSDENLSSFFFSWLFHHFWDLETYFAQKQQKNDTLIYSRANSTVILFLLLFSSQM